MCTTKGEHPPTKEDTAMTRFERELNGSLGAYWQAQAQKELERVANDLATGKITIDENGVAYNCIGRPLMSDMAEKVALVTDRINREATAKAESEEAAKSIEAYRANRRQNGYSAEELHEMRAAFGEGTTVVDILTGKKISL